LILAGGPPEGWGVALVGGTGSVCLGRTREGRTVRVGGWGPILGDEGSGYQIAVNALRRPTQTADGRASAKAVRGVEQDGRGEPAPGPLRRTPAGQRPAGGDGEDRGRRRPRELRHRPAPRR